MRHLQLVTENFIPTVKLLAPTLLLTRDPNRLASYRLKVRKQLKRLDEGDFTFGTVGKANFNTEPFNWADLRHGTARQVLLDHRCKDYRLTIFTRSDLIAHDDYASLLATNIKVVILIPNCTDQELRDHEPAFPSIKRRMNAYDKLKELGAQVSIHKYELKKTKLKQAK